MPTQHSEKKFAGKLTFALLVLLLLCEYAEVLIGGYSFFFRDFAIFAYPNAYYVRNSFLNSEIPFWNPLNEFGIPFLAQWNTMVLYPFNLLFFLFPPEWGISIFPILHLVFGGIGMYCLARYFVGNNFAAFLIALGYQFNGITINSLMWTNNSAAFGWMPWCILSVLRAIGSDKSKYIVVSIIICSMQILTGAPEIIGFTWIIILFSASIEFLKSAKKSAIVKNFSLICIGSLALTAIQLLPFIQLLANSHRVTSGGDTNWSLGSLFCLITPFYNSFEWSYGVIFQKDQYWTSSIYIPIGLIWLGIVGIFYNRSHYKWLFIILSIAGVLIALGNNFIVYPLLKKILPFFDLIRFPIKFIILYMFSIILLAGYGFKFVTEHGNFRRKYIPLLVYVLLVGLLAISAILSINTHNQGLPKDFIIKNLALRIIFLTSFVSIPYLLRKKPDFSHIFLIAAMILLFLDFKTHAPKQNPSVESWVYKPDLLNAERPDGFKNGRIFTRHDKDFYKFNQIKNDPVSDVLSKRLGLYSNLNLLEGLAKLTGMFSLHLRESKIILDKLFEDEDNIPDGFADFSGIRWRPAPGKQYVWEPRRTAMQLISAGQNILWLNEIQTFEKIFSKEFNPQTTVFLQDDSPNPLRNEANPNVSVLLTEITANRLKATISCDTTTSVVFSMAYYPCWEALVDGKNSKIYKANYGFQAIIVPAGNHIVEFIYRDKLFYTGLIFSALTCITLCFFLIRRD